MRHQLSDAAWAEIQPDLPRGKPGKPRVDDRRVISGILHVLKTGCRWRDVPAAYGPATTSTTGNHRWPGRAEPRQLACEGASLGRLRNREEWAQAVGRSRGGRTTKIHCRSDDRGRPVAIALTPGNTANISMALPLLDASAPSKRLIADKAYDADSLRT